MKKKKLLKRIEELERRINNKNYYDWSKAIVDNRGKSAYVVCSGEYNVPLASKNENLNLMFPKYCKECKLKKELTTTFNIISLDDNIFDIKSRPKIEVKIFSNLVQRNEK